MHVCTCCSTYNESNNQLNIYIYLSVQARVCPIQLRLQRSYIHAIEVIDCSIRVFLIVVVALQKVYELRKKLACWIRTLVS